MTAISDLIVAMGPYLYWPLDEASGTVARNLGSGSLAGTISGDIDMAVTGPTPTDPAMRFYLGGQVLSPIMDLATFGDWSLMFFCTAPATGALASRTMFGGFGDPANPVVRGVRWGLSSSSADQLNVGMNGSIQSTGITAPQPAQYWHLYTFTYRASTLNWTPYVDNLAGSPNVNSPGVSWTNADRFYLIGNTAVAVCHIAFFRAVLSNAQIASVAAQIQGWPYIVPSNQVPGGGGGGGDNTEVLTAIAEVQNDVNTLLANWSTYTGTTLPSLQDMLNHLSAQSTAIQTDVTNIINSLFPQLADVLNDIGTAVNDVQNAVRGTLSDGASNLVRTVGELLSNVNRDHLAQVSLTGGPTCSPIHLDVAGSRLYGIILYITAYPEDWRFRTPDQAWSLKDLAVIRIYHHGQLIERHGVHTIVYTLEPIPQRTLPWIGPLVPLQPEGTIITVDFAAGVCGELVGTQISS